MRTAQRIKVSCKSRTQQKVSSELRIETFAFLTKPTSSETIILQQPCQPICSNQTSFAKLPSSAFANPLLSVILCTNKIDRAPDKSAPISSPTCLAPQSIKSQS